MLNSIQVDSMKGTYTLVTFYVVVNLGAARSQPSFGFNLPPLGIGGGISGGQYLDFRDTSTRFFTDLFKHSTSFSENTCCGDDAGIQVASFSSAGVRTGDWVHYGIPTEHQVRWRPDGYPANLDRWPSGNSEMRISAVAHIGKGGDSVRPGLYLCRFDGRGDVDFERDAAVVRRYDNNTLLVNVTPAAGVRVRITRTNATDPVRNLTILPLGLSDGAAGDFHPEFLAQLAGAAVLRFSGWLRVDNNDYNPHNSPRLWDNRTLPGHQTQACLRGVAVEHMVALCNAVGAAPWFGLPSAAAAADDYHARFAALVRETLDERLSVYVEYRDEGPGSLSTSQAQQSLMIFGIWERNFGPSVAAGGRLRRVANLMLGFSLQGFGADLAKVDAISTPATFGRMCPAQVCGSLLDFGEIQAPFLYRNHSVEQMVDVLRATALAAEVGWVEVVNVVRADAPGREVLGYTSGPNVAARSYGWRLAWSSIYGPDGCQSCLWERMQVKYGAAGLARRQGPDGWVVQESWACPEAGVTYRPAAANATFGNVTRGQSMAAAAPEACKAACGRSVNCSGFSYNTTSRVCFFVGNVAAFDPPGSATSLPAGSPNLRALGGGAVDAACYSRGAPTPRAAPDAAFATCSGKCSATNFWTIPAITWGDLDYLDAVAANVTEGAALEQRLAETLAAANAHPRMRGVMMDALERFRRAAGPNGTVCAPPLAYRPGTWAFAGGFTRNVNTADFALARSPVGPPSAKAEGMRAWAAGEPLTLPFTAADYPPDGAAAAAGGGGGPDACGGRCVWGLCDGGACACFVGYQGDNCTEASADVRPPNECQGTGSPIGINLAGFSYWSTEVNYVDVFKQSGLGELGGNQGWIAQGWVNSGWDLREPIELVGGYPARLGTNRRAGRMMVRDLSRHGVSGVYTVLYDGDGVLRFSMSDVKQIYRPRPGRVEVTVQLSTDFNNGLFLTIDRTNPLDPIRNIRVYLPGYERGVGHMGSPFHPAYIHTIKRYRALRFMDWQATNEVMPGNWSQRPTRGDVSYNNAGAPLEDMLLLSNMVAADPWFCIPHLADDGYVRAFATMVRDSLRPDRKAYIEYSNELWHTGFPGGQYAEARGAALGIGRFCFTVMRLRNISRIFQDVFGPQGRRRFVVVVSSQTVNADATRQLLACNIGQAGADVDAVALGPYFDGYSTGIKDVTGLIASYNASIDTTLAQVASHAVLTRAKNFSLLVYEGGPGAPVGSFGDLGIATHRDPRMRGLVARYYSRLAAAGMRLLMHFSSAGLPSRYGAWGLLESTDQDPAQAYKQQGLFDVMEAQSVCPLPNATCDAASAVSCSGHGYCLGGTAGCFCFYGYWGAQCDQAAYTEHYACGYQCTFGQGVCKPMRVEGFERYWGCECGLGYWGSTCSRFTCEDSCSNAGLCIDNNVCSCYPGYSGARCEQDCGCNGHGACGPDGRTCVCDDGWRLGADGRCEWDCSCPEGVPCSGPGVCACVEGCQFGACVRGRCQCWAGYAGADCNTKVPKPNDGSPVGMNLAGIGYGLDRVFVDVMKHSSDWVSVPGQDTANTSAGQYIWGDGQPVIQNSSTGWLLSVGLRQEVVTLMLRDICRHGAAGRYAVLYDGDGELDFGMDADVIARYKGRIDIKFKPTCDPSCWFDVPGWRPYCTDNGLYMRVISTNPANPLRNIRIIMPGFVDRYDAAPFHPYYLKSLERYSLLRFMDMQHTNSAPDSVRWADRVLPEARSYSLSGVPVEVMLALANTLGADAWFCMPHGADDDYVTRFAQLALETLRPDVRVYVEYSNEVWNLLFPQGKYAQRMGLALNLTKVGKPCVTYSGHCPRYRFHSRRSREIFALWAAVWAPVGMRGRLRFVLSSWGADPAVTREILSFEDAYLTADLVAITGYMTSADAVTSSWSPLSVDQVFTKLYQGLPSLATQVAAHRAAARTFNKSLIAYEAGPGLVENGVIEGGGATGAVTSLLIATARDARMEAFYSEGIRVLRREGLFAPEADDRPFVAFSSSGPFSKYGTWGHLEWTRQAPSLAPKYRALQAVISNATGTSNLKAGPGGGAPGRGCFDPRFGQWGLGDGLFLGPPAVSAPAAGDVWAAGSEYDIVWDTDGAEAAYYSPGGMVSIALWQVGTCSGLAGAAKVAVVSAWVSDSGRLRWTLPSGLPPRADYLIEVRKSAVTYISEPFSVTRPGGSVLTVSSWSACSAACGYGVRRRQLSCMSAPQPSREAAKPVAVAVNSADTSCLDPTHTLPQLIRNKYTGNMEVQTVNGTAASHWAVQPSFLIIQCTRLTSGCVQYYTARRGPPLTPPYLHGNTKPLEDCTSATPANPRTRNITLGGTSAGSGCVATGIQPVTEEVCFERPCAAYDWVVGDWGLCSVTCGGGTQERTVMCMDAFGSAVASSFCVDSGRGAEPVSSRACNQATCPTYFWSVSETGWSTCVASCGPGYKTRAVACKSLSPPAVVSESLCVGERPASVMSCNGTSCSLPHWVVGAWGQCSALCGGGERLRNVSCEVAGVAVDNVQCQSAVGYSPAVVEICNSWPCELLGWTVGAWGACNKSCGGGTAIRSVNCQSSTRGIVAPALCLGAGIIQPSSSTSCNQAACSPCSATPQCNGHGMCNAGDATVCVCSDGFFGDDCGLFNPCNGTGILDKNGRCCAGARDSAGACCPTGQAVDACGSCGGSGLAVDVRGLCCTGALDAGGVCCNASSGVDACGVCGGTGESCATAISLGLSVNLSLVGEYLSERRANFTNSLQSYLASAMGVSDDLVIIQSLLTSADAFSLRRRLLQTTGSVQVMGQLLPSSSTSGGVATGQWLVQQSLAGPDSKLGDMQVLSVTSSPSGVCGNGICEVGEICDSTGLASGCCSTDCPYTLNLCPTSASGGSLPCSGNGVCLTGSGVCSCFDGFSGTACDEATFSRAAASSFSGDGPAINVDPTTIVNRLRAERTDYFKCVDSELVEATPLYRTNHEYSWAQIQCIDWTDGKPVFVRGTYGMVRNGSRLLAVLSVSELSVADQFGYFEGTFSDDQTAQYKWYESSAPNTTDIGNASVTYSAFENKFSIRGIWSSTVTGFRGRWNATNCINMTDSVTIVDMMKDCLWSPVTNQSLVKKTLNHNRSSINMSKFANTQGSNDWCYNNRSAGTYQYNYSAEECQTLPCSISGTWETGTYQKLRNNLGNAVDAVLTDTFAYFGSWIAETGPAQGWSGPDLYVVLFDHNSSLKLRGFYCLWNTSAKIRTDCFFETYNFLPIPALCAGECRSKDRTVCCSRVLRDPSVEWSVDFKKSVSLASIEMWFASWDGRHILPIWSQSQLKNLEVRTGFNSSINQLCWIPHFTDGSLQSLDPKLERIAPGYFAVGFGVQCDVHLRYLSVKAPQLYIPNAMPMGDTMVEVCVYPRVAASGRTFGFWFSQGNSTTSLMVQFRHSQIKRGEYGASDSSIRELESVDVALYSGGECNLVGNCDGNFVRRLTKVGKVNSQLDAWTSNLSLPGGLLPGTYWLRLSSSVFYSTAIHFDFPTEETLHVSLVKRAPLGGLRVVLVWGVKPLDVDLNVMTFVPPHQISNTGWPTSYVANKDHLFSSQPDLKWGGVTFDTDAKNGYGPETVTFNATANSSLQYHIAVNVFNSDELEVFGGDLGFVQVNIYNSTTLVFSAKPSASVAQAMGWYVGVVTVTQDGSQTSEFSFQSVDSEISAITGGEPTFNLQFAHSQIQAGEYSTSPFTEDLYTIDVSFFNDSKACNEQGICTGYSEWLEKIGSVASDGRSWTARVIRPVSNTEGWLKFSSEIFYSQAIQWNASSVEYKPVEMVRRVCSGCLRIVLSWGAIPYDLDLHVMDVLPPASVTRTGWLDTVDDRDHVFWANRGPLWSGVVLDVDDDMQFGPETITMGNNVDRSRNYSVAVHVYNTTMNETFGSGAEQVAVSIYNSSGLVYRVKGDPSKIGDAMYWEVVSISRPTASSSWVITTSPSAP